MFDALAHATAFAIVIGALYIAVALRAERAARRHADRAARTSRLAVSARGSYPANRGRGGAR